MKPRTIALISVAGTLGVLITVGVPLALLTELLHRPAQRFPVAVAARPMVQPMPNNMVVMGGAVWNNQPVAVPVAREQIREIRGSVAGPKDVKISGPFEHTNLGVFLIHGPDKLKGKAFLTLHEALANNQAVVHDRGMVVVENRSDTPVFIQSGDIVKGGNQDRTIEYDQLLPPRSGEITVHANCVEQGRSFPRGFESAQQFLTAAEQLPTRSLRLANLRNSQGDVWSGVQLTQSNLARSVGVSVQSPVSATSLQLTLENERVLGEIYKYLNKLTPNIQDKKDVIGFAVAVNGKLQSADVYASAELFRKLQLKLLRAAAIQALAERSGQGRFELPKTQGVLAFLAEPAGVNANRHDVSGQVRMISQESAQSILYDTCALGQQNLVLHRCVLAK
jgi:hypothetical protein